MGNITLVTGGAGSGKTRWAISYFEACDNVMFINTGGAMSEDARRRMEFSIEKNRVNWTVEEYVEDPLPLIKDHSFYIFDGLASYTSVVMRQVARDIMNISRGEFEEIRRTVIDNVIACIDRVNAINGAMVIITIEPGFSVCPKDPEQTLFREIMGAVNQRVANTAQEVYLSASGIQFKIK